MFRYRSINTIFIYSIILFFSDFVYAQILDESKLIPIDSKQNFYEFTFSDKSYANDIAENSLSINGFFLSRYFFKITSMNNLNNLKNYPKYINPNYKIEIGFLDKNKIFNATKLKVQEIKEISFPCFETSSYVVLIQSQNCNTNGKQFFLSDDENNSISLSGREVSVFSEFNKTLYSWNQKINFSLGGSFSYLERNTRFSSGFENVKKDQSKLRIDNDKWFENTLYSNLNYVRIFWEDISAGIGVSTFHKTFDFNKNSIDNKKSNIKIDFQLTKKTRENLYFGIGGFISSNYLGFNNLKQNTAFSDKNKNPKSIYIKIGMLSSVSQFEDFDYTNFIEDNKIDLENNNTYFIQQTKKNDTNKKQNIDVNKNIYMNISKKQKLEKLYDFAISFAKSYDKI